MDLEHIIAAGQFDKKLQELKFKDVSEWRAYWHAHSKNNYKESSIRTYTSLLKNNRDMSPIAKADAIQVLKNRQTEIKKTLFPPKAFGPVTQDEWPGDVFLKNLNAVLRQESDSKNANKELCVLLTTGAMNPVHRGHIDMVVRAKKALELEYNYKVLAGWISPSHDLYVRPKSESRGTTFASASTRCKLVELLMNEMTEAKDWLRCGRWESNYEGRWPDFPEVVAALEKYLTNLVASKNINRSIVVIYVCGTDHARYCSHGFNSPNQGVIAVPRNKDKQIRVSKDKRVYCVHEKNNVVEAYSSTKARTALKAGDLPMARAMLGSSVIKFIQQKSLYECSIKFIDTICKDACDDIDTAIAKANADITTIVLKKEQETATRAEVDAIRAEFTQRLAQLNEKLAKAEAELQASQAQNRVAAARVAELEAENAKNMSWSQKFQVAERERLRLANQLSTLKTGLQDLTGL